MRGKRRKMREMRSRLIFGACTVIKLQRKTPMLASGM